MQKPSVSVIIPAFQDDVRLAHCLECLQRQDYEGDIEILVIDNSESFSLSELAARFPSVRFDWEPAPGSYNARNKALGLARGDVFAFTDTDCAPHANWVSEGVSALMSNPRAGMAGGRIDIVPQSPDRPTLAELFDILTSFDQETSLHDGKYAATANVFAHRAAMQRVGPFNGALRSGGDVDWGKRCAAAGFEQVYAAHAVVDHPARRRDELLKKIRRIVGGERDRGPDWSSCLRYAWRHFRPPRHRIASVFKYRRAGLTPAHRLGLVAYCVTMNWAHCFERLRLQLFGGVSERS